MSSSTPSESTTHRILCYGDSLTAGTSESMDLSPYAPHLEHALGDSRFMVRHRGMPGWTANAMVEAAEDPNYGLRSAVRGKSLSCVIILAGTNDLGYAAAAPEEERVSYVLKPVQALHEMAWTEGVPRTMAIALPPSGYQAQVAEAANLAQRVNQKLQEFCQQSEGKAVFVPFPFGYERGGDNWCQDGLHFSPNGYQVLGKYLADPVLQLLNGLEA